MVVVAVMATTAWAASAKLYINGKLASSSLLIIDGRSYVPVADPAKAQGATIVKRSDGYELTLAAGTYQLTQVAEGKVGDKPLDGEWCFQVLPVEEVDGAHEERYAPERRRLQPANPGDRLWVLQCRLENGRAESQTPMLTERQPGNTSLADAQGHSFPPLSYDARQEINKTQSYVAPALLPCAATESALVFSVPPGVQPAALVFSL